MTYVATTERATLVIDAAPFGREWSISGSIMGGADVWMVQLVAGSTEVAIAEPDPLGEFRFVGIDPGVYELYLSGDDEDSYLDIELPAR